MWDACKKIKLQEGYGGFFTGLKVAILRDVPFSGIYYPLYEESKVFFRAIDPFYTGSASSLLLISSLASLNANFLSCLMTHPIDIIRTRILF